MSVEFARQEYCSGLPFPTPGDLPNPGIESQSPASPTLIGGCFFLPLSYLGSPVTILAGPIDPHYYKDIGLLLSYIMRTEKRILRLRGFPGVPLGAPMANLKRQLHPPQPPSSMET